jgi:lysophospholipase L1-like esterase
VDIDTPLTNPFTVPEGAKYFRCTLTNEVDIPNAWIFNENKKPSDIPTYQFTENIIIPKDAIAPCDFTGLDVTSFNKCLCIGDSLTAGTFNHCDSGQNQYVDYDKYSYPRYFERITGITTTNMGRGGYTSAEWYNEYKNSDLSGYDIAIIQLGVNDSFRYGEFGETSKTAFRNIVNKLKSDNKNIRIFIANIIPGRSFHSEVVVKFSADLLAWLETEYVNDKMVIPLDIQKNGHTYNEDAYNCGHLSAYGYNRLARDYVAYISWYMSNNPGDFKEIQFIGTDYWYDNPNK